MPSWPIPSVLLPLPTNIHLVLAWGTNVEVTLGLFLATHAFPLLLISILLIFKFKNNKHFLDTCFRLDTLLGVCFSFI